jgi:cbb3-type cytochrome oxidase subunit 3
VPVEISLIVKFIFSTVELCTATVLALSLFRFPLRYNIGKILLISVTMASFAFYLREFAMLKNYAVLSMISVEMILITLLFSLPIYYSLLISIVGFMLGGIIEYFVMTLATLLNLTSVELIKTNYVHSSLIFIATAIIISLITYYIRYRKFGFMFMANKLTMKIAIQRYNFSLSGVLVIFLLFIQLTSLSYDRISIHSFILISLSLVFIIGIIIAYKHNKKLLREKYERLQNR